MCVCVCYEIRAIGRWGDGEMGGWGDGEITHPSGRNPLIPYPLSPSAAKFMSRKLPQGTYLSVGQEHPKHTRLQLHAVALIYE